MLAKGVARNTYKTRVFLDERVRLGHAAAQVQALEALPLGDIKPGVGQRHAMRLDATHVLHAGDVFQRRRVERGLRVQRIRYFSASSLSVAFTVCSICARVTPSIVVGIWVGSEVGWTLCTVTTPSDLTRLSKAGAGAVTGTGLGVHSTTQNRKGHRESQGDYAASRNSKISD